jgi:hypothetical protein
VGPTNPATPNLALSASTFWHAVSICAKRKKSFRPAPRLGGPSEIAEKLRFAQLFVCKTKGFLREEKF